MFTNALRFVLIIIFLISSCRPIQNYLEPDSPKFEGVYIKDKEIPDRVLKVITWNIRFSLETEKAIEELYDKDELNEADLLLLQEVDEKSVKSIAESLRYAYIYYPASKHTFHNNNFGNAVLSKWPIIYTEKVILPYQNPKNQQKRIAVKAGVIIRDDRVAVYSVHTETNWMSKKRRDIQINYLINEVGGDDEHVIIGGDFNTLLNASVRNLENILSKKDMVRATKRVGYSVDFLGFKFPMDHIFTKNFRVLANGIWQGSLASDHFPVWVILEFDD